MLTSKNTEHIAIGHSKNIATQSQRKKYTLFIGCIPGRTSAQDLIKKYSHLGKIFEIKIKKKKIKKGGAGYGTFSTFDKNLYNFLVSTPQKILGREITCRPSLHGEEKQKYLASLHNRRIFVKGLKQSWSDKQIFELFSSRWGIERAYAIRGRNGQSKGFGYINFKVYEDAKQVIDMKTCYFGKSRIQCYPYYRSKDYKLLKKFEKKTRKFSKETSGANAQIQQNNVRIPIQSPISQQAQAHRRRPDLDFSRDDPLKCTLVVQTMNKVKFAINHLSKANNLRMNKNDCNQKGGFINYSKY